MSILALYYSRTGRTKKVAERLSALLKADLEPLHDQDDRRGFLGYVRSGRDAILKRPAILQPLAHAPADYDLVVLGSPIWAFTICSAVRTFLEQHAPAIRRAAFFCTHGGGGAARAPAEVESLLGSPLAVPVLSLQDRIVDRGEGETEIARFVESLVALFPNSLRV